MEENYTTALDLGRLIASGLTGYRSQLFSGGIPSIFAMSQPSAASDEPVDTNPKPPSWIDYFNQFDQQHRDKYGRTIDRPWTADPDAWAAKQNIDKQYLDALSAFNSQYGTDYQPESQHLGEAQTTPYYKKKKSGWFDTVLDVLGPGRKIADAVGLPEWVASLTDPIGMSAQRANDAYKSGDIYSQFHNALGLSPFIDDAVGGVGKFANRVSDGASGQFVSAVAPIIGGIIGTAYGGPVGAMAGAAAGKMFSGRWNGLSEEEIQHGTAIAGGTAYARSALGGLLSDGGATSSLGGDALGGGLTDPEMLRLAGEGGFTPYSVNTAGYGGIEFAFPDQIGGYTPSQLDTMYPHGGGIESGYGFENQIGDPTGATPDVPGGDLLSRAGRRILKALLGKDGAGRASNSSRSANDMAKEIARSSIATNIFTPRQKEYTPWEQYIPELFGVTSPAAKMNIIDRLL
jgi:hypothetical protein